MILSPNLDPKARALQVTFRLFFLSGTKRGPRGDQEVPKGTTKAPRGSPGVPKRESRRRPGYPKRVLGDLFTARWRGGRRQSDRARACDGTSGVQRVPLGSAK